MRAINCQPIKEVTLDSYQIGRPPWHLAVYSLASWWDMEQFSAEKYFAIAVIFERMRAKYRAPKIVGDEMFARKEYVLPYEEQSWLADNFRALGDYCLEIGLTISAKNARMLQDILAQESDKTGNIWVAWEIEKALQIVMDEMKEHLFLYVRTERARYYQRPLDGWEEAIERFPQVRADVEEASRCFACDRYAGAIFHAMLVAEIGAIEVGKLIGIDDPKPGWPSTIREMNRIVHREKYPDLKPIEQKHRDILGQLLPMMESMQDAWRHKISHVENKLVLMTGDFNDRVAEEILIATRSFMRRLATEMP